MLAARSVMARLRRTSTRRPPAAMIVPEINGGRGGSGNRNVDRRLSGQGKAALRQEAGGKRKRQVAGELHRDRPVARDPERAAALEGQTARAGDRGVERQRVFRKTTLCGDVERADICRARLGDRRIGPFQVICDVGGRRRSLGDDRAADGAAGAERGGERIGDFRGQGVERGGQIQPRTGRAGHRDPALAGRDQQVLEADDAVLDRDRRRRTQFKGNFLRCRAEARQGSPRFVHPHSRCRRAG